MHQVHLELWDANTWVSHQLVAEMRYPLSLDPGSSLHWCPTPADVPSVVSISPRWYPLTNLSSGHMNAAASACAASKNSEPLLYGVLWVFRTASSALPLSSRWGSSLGLPADWQCYRGPPGPVSSHSPPNERPLRRSRPAGVSTMRNEWHQWFFS